MQRGKTKTLALASLLVLVTSAALAQATSSNGGNPGANFDTGVSGRTSGLISGGGSVSSSLDADISASPSAGSRPKASSARAGEEAAGAEANARVDSNAGPRVKTKKQQTSGRASGFTSFGARGYRSRQDQ
jgi:hypothetical protein